MYLMMLDGGVEFTDAAQRPRPVAAVAAPERVLPPPGARLVVLLRAARAPRTAARGADLLMACSDYPHSEGTATPLADYAATGKFGTDPEPAPGLFGDNADFLLGLTPGYECAPRPS